MGTHHLSSINFYIHYSTCTHQLLQQTLFEELWIFWTVEDEHYNSTRFCKMGALKHGDVIDVIDLGRFRWKFTGLSHCLFCACRHCWCCIWCVHYRSGRFEQFRLTQESSHDLSLSFVSVISKPWAAVCYVGDSTFLYLWGNILYILPPPCLWWHYIVLSRKAVLDDCALNYVKTMEINQLFADVNNDILMPFSWNTAKATLNILGLDPSLCDMINTSISNGVYNNLQWRFCIISYVFRYVILWIFVLILVQKTQV